MLDLNGIFKTYGFRLAANNNETFLYNSRKNQEVNVQTIAAQYQHLNKPLNKKLLTDEVFKNILPFKGLFKISNIDVFISSFQLPSDWLHIHPSILGLVNFTFDPVDSTLTPVIWEKVVIDSTAKMLTRGAMPASLFPEYQLKTTFFKDDNSLLEQAGFEVLNLLKKRTQDFATSDISNLKDEIFNAFLLKANNENEYLNNIVSSNEKTTTSFEI